MWRIIDSTDDNAKIKRGKSMKKNQKLLLIAMIIIVIVIVLIELYFKLLYNGPLYSCSYVNFNMGGQFGYIIYYNGIIIKYDDYNEDKKGKISKDELKKLKNLASSVKDEYKKIEKGSGIVDASDCTKEVYSTRLKKWVVLLKSGDRFNPSKESKEIQDFAEELYNKYVK